MTMVTAARRLRSLAFDVVCFGLLVAGMPELALARDAGGPRVTTVLEMDSPLEHGEYAWDAAGAPDAPVRVVVDLTAEKLYVYRGGVEIGRAFILFGADEKPTPTGTFTILQKKKDHVSNLYGAPMPYMLRLTWGGVAIHGSEVEAGYATHGCIGVPDEFAAELFAVAKMGGEVLVTHDWLPEVYREGAAAELASAG